MPESDPTPTSGIAIAVQLALLKEGQRELIEDVRMIKTQIEGPPREGSIRDRIHHLEGQQAAARAAEAALSVVRELNNRKHSWTLRVTVALFAAVTLACTLWTTVDVTTNNDRPAVTVIETTTTTPPFP